MSSPKNSVLEEASLVKTGLAGGIGELEVLGPLEALLGNVHIFLIDQDMKVEAASSAARALLESSDWPNRIGLLDLIAADSRDEFSDYLKAFLDGKPTGKTLDCRMTITGGEPIYAELRLLKGDVLGNADCFILSATDITRRKQNEMAFRQMSEGSNWGLIVHRGGSPLFVNEQMARMIGLESPDILYEKSLTEYIHPDDWEFVAKNIRSRMHGLPATDNYEFRLIGANGQPFWVSCRARVIDWEDGPAVLAACIDITKQKEIEAAKQESEALFAKVCQLSPDVMNVTELDSGILRFASDNIFDFFGYLPEEVMGKSVAELDVWVDNEERKRIVELIRKIGVVIDHPVSLKHRDGKHFKASLSASVLEFGDEKLMISVTRDITDKMRWTRELTESKETAERANRSKSEFLANMSHELRTPLNAILGFSEIMKNQTFGDLGSERYVEYAGDIHRSGSHLLEIIRDILDLSRVEAGKLEVLEERVNLRRSLQLVLKMMFQQAQEGKVRLITEAVPEDMVILADKKRMHQVFLNLLSNAVKFTPEGGQVEISAALTDDGGAVIVVGDTGIGMSEAEIEEAMTPFGQIDSIMTRKKEGTGLGLPLVKAFVERQGGRLVIESEPGKGTDVKILFPPDRILDP